MRDDARAERAAVEESQWERLLGPVTLKQRPQALFAEEDLEDARRQLILYGRDGLPVLSRDGQLRGWLTRADILRALATKLSTSEEEIQDGAIAADLGVKAPRPAVHEPSTPLRDYETVELLIPPDSPARGKRIADIHWPPGCIVGAVTQGREIHAARPDLQLQPGERVILLTPANNHDHDQPPTAATTTTNPPPVANGDTSRPGTLQA
ncbi:MAG TPA: TrkA C-terminal domain-containing protein, partial [Solirubrobacteraceae bacterium]|nr:TrkA C-terminal domain-containing protein [Solirubrobacteraceae bacterium]